MSNKPSGTASYDSEDPSVEEEEEEVDYDVRQVTSRRTSGKGEIQFLDLTNGEGGDQQNKNLYYDETEEEVEEDEEEGDESDAIDQSTSPNSKISMTRQVTTKNVTSLGSTPTNLPRLVENGREHTGRWTRDEHLKFLAALNLYGKEWKKVAAHVRTRTVVQTRTHAQKYFQKMFKTGEKGFDASHEKLISGSKVLPAVATTKVSFKKRNKPLLVTNSVPQATICTSTSAAARLLTNLPTGSLPAAVKSTPVLSTIPSPSFSASTNLKGTSKLALPPATSHGFSKPSSLAEPRLPPPVTTSSVIPQSTSSNPSLLHERNADVVSAPSSTSSSSWNISKPISIVVPDPDIALRRGFPEPSPAATGKRKLDELAVAQMFAILASSSSAPSSSHNCNEDDRATPPPPPPPPFMMSSSPPPCLTKPSGRLQIVNPDTLGTVPTPRHRENEPTTPWDGQLEQLITEERLKVHPSDSRTIMDDFVDDNHASNHFPHVVSGPGYLYGRSPIHKAVCEMDMAAVHQELSDPIRATNLHRKDEKGYLPLHSACTLSWLDPLNASVACEITRLLVASGADPSAVDSERNTPLHWAVRAADTAVAQFLILQKCPIDAQNNDGDTPLHWAMRCGRRGRDCVRVLIEHGCRVSIINNNFKRPIDVSGEGYADSKSSKPDQDIKKANIGNKHKAKVDIRKHQEALIEEIRDSRLHLLSLSLQSRTLVLHHPECLEHIPKSSSDWECPDRVTTIMRRLLPDINNTETTGIFPHEVVVSTEFDKAKLDFLSRVHSSDYLSFVNDLSKELTKRNEDTDKVNNEFGMSENRSVVPFTPMIQKAVMRSFGVAVKKDSHSDTSFSAGSLRAARRAAGAVQHAVDSVMIGRHRNAFCVVRPPGHHAGVKGLLAGAESCGFCIFNNVAAGALHAISEERLLCQRCAIVDIDVHHGNGTEEIVKRCHNPAKLFFFSIHLHDNDKRKNSYNFYPGTGDEDDLTHNVINVPIVPLWKESTQSTNTTASTINSHNTRQRSKRKAEEVVDINGEVTKDDTSETGVVSNVDAADTESESASMRSSHYVGSSSNTSNKNSKNVPTNMGRLAYRRAIQNRLLPSLRAFNPDLILISAGFDAAKGDVGNARHFGGGKERMGLDLEPEDYAWTTRKILEIADICCQGRVVSVLEGGYGRSPVIPPSQTDSSSKTETSNSLDKAFFSECAIRHLHALIDPYDQEARFGPDRITPLT